MLDGARNALLGYLYQLLTTASVTVRRVDSHDDAWADLIATIGIGVIRTEEFGQDATIRPLTNPDAGVMAIQFKHSANAGHLIEKRELIQILARFDNSRREAASNGTGIDRYQLITNRDLDQNVDLLLAAVREGREPAGALHVRTRTSSKAIAANVALLEPYQGSAEAAETAWIAVLREMTVVRALAFEESLQGLRGFAARHGVLEDEWRDRLGALIGALVLGVAGGRPIDLTKEWLKQHLIGDANAADLAFDSEASPHLARLCQDHLATRLRRNHQVPASCYLPRQVQKEIADCLASSPLVFVYGDGGCGKSMAVAEYLRSLGNKQLVWTVLAREATEASIVDALNNLRLPGRHGAGRDRSLEGVRTRLRAANPGDRVLWTIDIDGIDEAPDRVAELRSLITLCWSEGDRDSSPASLIVTCREPGSTSPTRQLLYEWLDAPELDLVAGVGFVHVHVFTDGELFDAASRLNGLPEDRIKRALDLDLAAPTPSDSLPAGEELPDAILQALHHPVVWGHYAYLPEPQRSGVLEGDPHSLSLLAVRILDRFLVRCHSRRLWPNAPNLRSALGVIARSLTGAPRYSSEEWTHAAGDMLSRQEAESLYWESAAYGLVVRESRIHWRWGHRFLVDYLATLAVGEAEQ